MAPKAIALRTPQTALEVIESWADLPADARKRRAAEASQTGDRQALRTLLDAYTGLHGRRGTDTSPRTLSTYWRGSLRFLAWCSRSGAKPHQVGGAEARRFLASIGELAPKSRQVYLTGARAMVAALRWAGLGEGEPFAGVKVLEPTSAAEKANPYSPDELRRLLAKANTRERALILLAADGGLRLAEAVSLTWAQVDLERARIAVVGKGRKRARVALTSRLLQALASLDRHGPNVLGISRRRVQAIFASLCKRAGVQPRGYHALRHSCGTRIYAATRDLLAVQRHLRHSTTRTSEIYAHLADEAYLAAVRALETNGTGP